MLITLDVGITTGFALFEADKVVGCGVIANTQIAQGLLSLKMHQPNATVVAERALVLGHSKLSLELLDVNAAVEVVFPDAHWITAGLWKPVTGSRDISKLFVRRLTTHERDAIRMGLWWMLSHDQDDPQ